MDARGQIIPVATAPQQQQQQQSYPLNVIHSSRRDVRVNGQRQPILLPTVLPMQTHAVPMGITNRVQIQYAQTAPQYLNKQKREEPPSVRSLPYRLDGWRNSNRQQHHAFRDSGIVKINDNGMCKIDMTRLINRRLLNQGGGAGPLPPPPPVVKLRPAANLRARRTVPNNGDQQLLATAGISDPALQKVFVDLFAAAAAATRHHEQQTAVKFSIFRSVELMAQSSCRRMN
ncbi:uncharacterized protein LOC125951750 [Anopheles darlingi]|uniref:uncharacterized protein LOC125951750 n=1 Tax=Anopheles darlingi TaxID=43151 RepID=UPI0021000070|nr:uncharacterized protein LOC125951750 [Anopheles darlingi]